jgi:uncharacterized protein (TIGR03083 family)
MALSAPEPVLVLDLFPDERRELLALLDGLSAEAWRRPTACPGWSVHDVALHLLGDELGQLSRGRDGFQSLAPRPGEVLVPFLNRINEEWVVAARRLSPRVLRDLLRRTGDETLEYFASLNPFEPGERVSWAGPDPAPRWLHVAREYTERWVHHQQIREAVGAPLLAEPRFFTPVLATFARALPRTFNGVVTIRDAQVGVYLTGPSGSDWTVVTRGEGRWELRSGRPEHAPNATVELDEDVAWRLFTRGLTPEAARPRARIGGDARLGELALHTVAIIA